ncbi:PPOX class F420-dependent oxidoreductase [Conyzicola sp.]|uniref:PPOX class F420-dependent oxidoreductase n=1 Tax=Conyzicola sp. TaxID=1969404 RepID=UPI003989CDB9
MTETRRLLALADEAFVSLTTFRRSGVAVSTPVWIARDGDHLIVTTPTESGKVKRLRNNSRVELRPCDRMGKVADDTAPVSGVAAVTAHRETVERSTAIIRKKYPVEYRLFMVVEALVAKRRKDRVILRISPAA